MAASFARQRGFPVNEQIAKQQINANRELLEKIRERLYQGYFVQVEDNFGSDILGYMLIALNASGYKADLNTDAVSIYIRARQGADGHWEVGRADTRPPLGSGFIEDGAGVALAPVIPSADGDGRLRACGEPGRELGCRGRTSAATTISRGKSSACPGQGRTKRHLTTPPVGLRRRNARMAAGPICPRWRALLTRRGRH